MRFVVIQDVVLNTDAIDMIAPQGAQSLVSLRGGATQVFDLSTSELLEHLRHANDEVVRVAQDSDRDGVNAGPSHVNEESA